MGKNKVASPSPVLCETPTPSKAQGPRLTRRQLLAGTGKAALFALLPQACAPLGNTPFSDGTFWDDGLGWTI